MATQSLVAPETYLTMSFEGPDREYVDGELVERGMPTYLHARIQMILGALFETLRKQHPVFAASELRLALHSHHRYPGCLRLRRPRAHRRLPRYAPASGH